jgi:hypothetical protein
VVVAASSAAHAPRASASNNAVIADFLMVLPL